MTWQSQLPKWHPLHKKPEEDYKMNPGTERALVALTESWLPQLSKTISALTEAVKELITVTLTKPAQPNEGLVGALVLTKEQWIELVEAIASKAVRVRHGHYDDLELAETQEEIESLAQHVDPEKWANELSTLHETVIKALADQGITL